VIYTLEQEAMQEVPAWPRYTGVLFCGHQPYDRRRGVHHEQGHCWAVPESKGTAPRLLDFA